MTLSRVAPPTLPQNRVLAAAVAVVMAVASVVVVWNGSSVESASPTLEPVNPSRLVDTRPGENTGDGAQKSLGRVGPDETLTIDVAGRGGVPDDAVAVMLNLTVVDAQRGGYAVVHPCGEEPTTSTVNYRARTVTASAAFVELTNGQACVSALGNPHVVIDVQAAATDRSDLTPVSLERLLDTRPDGQTLDGRSEGAGPVDPGDTVGVPLFGRTEIPSNAEAVLLNLTAVGPQADGHLIAYACGTGRPTGSALNFRAGEDTATSVFVAAGSGSLCIYASARTHVLVDAAAYTTSASQLMPTKSPRLADTRPEGRTDDRAYEATGAIAGGTSMRIPVAGRSGASAGASGAMLKVIAVAPQGAGFVTVYSCDSGVPWASNVNFGRGDTVSNLVVAPLSASGDVCVYASQTTHIVVDLEGVVISGTRPPAQTPAPDPSKPIFPGGPLPELPPIVPSTDPSGFVHPGILIDGAQLNEIRAQAAAGAQPWAQASAEMAGSRYGRLSYTPQPVSVLRAASSGNRSYIAARGWTNAGEVSHLDDARAAYTHALLWSQTGNQAHADKAIQIMNAWSSTLTEIKFDQPRRDDNNSQVWNNGKLQAGWGGSLFARAAEIIRYSGAGWSSSDIADFEDMLTDVYLPLTITGWSNGANWLMILTETTIAIGVFTNDRDVFDQGIDMWRDLAPTTIYHPSDGADPIPPAPSFDTPSRMRALWYNPSQWVPGLQAETLRDLSHMTMGLGAMSNGAETAAIQGVDLFGEQSARIVLGYETNAAWVNDYLDEIDRRGGAPSSSWRPDGWPGSRFGSGGVAFRSGWEVAHHHFVGRGVSMPETTRLVNRLRQDRGNQAALHMTWETVTHGI